jgi:predicted RNA binding protein YcfA (HicA-like mRNA interferase family)
VDVAVKKTLERARGSPQNVRFRDMTRLVESLGFRRARVSGSHHIFTHPDISELVNLQEVDGNCKPYQVRQVLKLIDRYKLKLGEES